MTNKELAAVVLAAHVSARQAMTINEPDTTMLDVGMRSMEIMAAQTLRSPLGAAARAWATSDMATLKEKRNTAIRLAMLVATGVTE